MFIVYIAGEARGKLCTELSGKWLGELILYYNPISLISVIVWTASARYILIIYFSLLIYIYLPIRSREQQLKDSVNDARSSLGAIVGRRLGLSFLLNGICSFTECFLRSRPDSTEGARKFQVLRVPTITQATIRIRILSWIRGLRLKNRRNLTWQGQVWTGIMWRYVFFWFSLYCCVWEQDIIVKNTLNINTTSFYHL